MNKEMIDRENLTDRYVLGCMDESECLEFKALMDEDEELEQDVAFMEALTESLGRREENIRKMKEWQTRTGSQVTGRVINFRRMSIAAAACAALFIGLSYPYSYYGLQDRGFLDSQMRGGTVELSECVENGQYGMALELIDSALAELEISLPTAAHKDYVFSEMDYLQWAKIQTLLKMSEYESAFTEVSEFRKDAGIYQQKADKLYNRLKLRLRI